MKCPPAWMSTPFRSNLQNPIWFQGRRGTPVSSLAQEEEGLAMGQRQRAQDIPSSHRQQARATALAQSLPWAGPLAR